MNEKQIYRVLIVDDEEAILIAYKKLFESRSFICDIAQDAASALSFIDNNNYDYLISDLKLCDENELQGLEIAKKFHEKFSESIIIIATAYGTNSIRKQIQETKNHFYFEKPVKISDIIEILNIGKSDVKSKFNFLKKIKAKLSSK